MYMTPTVQLHRRDVSTFTLRCPMKSMTCTLSYLCSTWAGDIKHVGESCYSFDKENNNNNDDGDDDDDDILHF